jgi:hypothetical protein
METGEQAGVIGAQELISRHEEWKLTFWAAVFSRKPLTLEQIDQIVHPKKCPIGRWLDGPESIPFRERQEFVDLLTDHESFHAEMLEVAALLGRKDFSNAAKAIGEDSSFVQCGRKLATSILAVNRLVRIVAPG